MDAWTIYWITRLTGIKLLFGIPGITLLIVAGVGFGLFMFAYFFEDDDDVLPALNISTVGLVVGFFMFTTFLFIPTTKEAVAIYALPKIANNEQVQEIGSNGMEYINEQLKAWIDDVREKE